MAASRERQQRVIEGMAVWGSYYRQNIDIFVRDYLQLDFLKWFQLMLLVMMDRARIFLWIAARGMGKSFLIAIFAVVRCILYPGTKVVITSGTRGQSINILEKIQTELMPASPNLRNEIDMSNTKFTGQDAKIMFKNTSYIKVVTASDNARSNRANILIVDEFRMVKKDTIDTVLKKFLTSRRMPPYKELTLEERKAEYAKEPNKSCFLSSAYFKDHWSYHKMLDTFKLMLDDTKTDFMCGFPYQLSIQEGLLFPEDVEGDMLETDFNEIKWSMEMEATWFGDEDGAFFDFNSISKDRRIQFPMLPGSVASLLGNNQKIRIPTKQNGERRILSADIALMSSKKHNNDASAVFINQMLPTKSGRYTNNIVYGDTFEGMHTEDQALIIRKLYDEFSCDYIVLDCTGLGLGVYDALVRDMVDPDTGEIYPALSCCNNQEMADRCTVRGAEKAIWAIKGSPQLNSECAVLLREGFRSGKIRLLVTEYDAESILPEIKGYNSLSVAEKVKVQMPYIHTTLLVNELVNLQHEESGGRVRVFERSGMRKDRYSSLSYNYYVSTQLESKISRSRKADYSENFFMYKPPKIK
nr:MAG TPA: large terminase [Caudoviricetes sp.]